MSQHAPVAFGETARADSALTAIAKLGLVLRHHAWQRRRHDGLTPTQAQALATLAARGAHRVGELARTLGVTQPTASDAVAALVRKGLVARERDSADGRAARLTATSAGTRRAAESAEWPDALLAAVDALSAEDQASLLRGLSAVIRELQQRGEIPVQRMCVTCRYFRPHVHAEAERPHHCAFVDAPFGDRALRLDCADHEPEEEAA
jgi:DNA-binding MarR family transcriptional regulator